MAEVVDLTGDLEPNEAKGDAQIERTLEREEASVAVDLTSPEKKPEPEPMGGDCGELAAKERGAKLCAKEMEMEDVQPVEESGGNVAGPATTGASQEGEPAKEDGGNDARKGKKRKGRLDESEKEERKRQREQERERKRQEREQEKRRKAERRTERLRANGKYMNEELTAVLDSDLARRQEGRDIAAALDRSGMLHTMDPNKEFATIEFWRHPPRKEPFQPARESPACANAERAPFVLAFVGPGTEEVKERIESVQRKYGQTAVSCFAVGQPDGNDADVAGMAIALQGGRHTTLSDKTHVPVYISSIVSAMASRPYREDEGTLTIFNTRLQPARNCASDDDTAGKRQQLGSKQALFRALRSIRGVGEADARAICNRFQSLGELMQAFSDPNLAEERRKRLLAGLKRINNDGSVASRAIGPCLSERIFLLFRPRPQNDTGSDLI